jgi:ribosome-binding protein aMBF1 (putative translation factor)
MPNIGTVLKDEIIRLSRRASHSQINPTKKATAQHRRDIALLKRQVTQLERQVTLLTRKVLGTPPAVSPSSNGKRVRFVVKGLRSQRKRLGLSATDFGKLLGVSAQSIYNWEQEQARPRDEQISRLVALRTIGKREDGERLKQLVATNGKAGRQA